MPVTIEVAPHRAEGYTIYSQDPRAESILESACPGQWRQCGELLQSSISQKENTTLVPQGNGFVEAVLAAYKQHHHLRIRPDDVWISILSQLSFYVNGHSEELREYFVAHEGKKQLTVVAIGNRYTVDFGSMARQMTLKMHDNVVDKTLVDWILPNFTTTTVNDTTVCSVLMMSSLKSYFEYRMMCKCGIPSVTLEGTRADWEKLLARLDRLPALGAQPTAWAAMLRPILSRFVSAFDAARAPELASMHKKFWNAVVHEQEVYYGPADLSGWITAFCVWDCDGTWRGDVVRGTRPVSRTSSVASVGPRPRGSKRVSVIAGPREGTEKRDHRASVAAPEKPRGYSLDGVSYPVFSVEEIPSGFCEVDVLLDDNGLEFDCLMVAGHTALAVSTSADTSKGCKNDTVAPAPQWFMFIKGSPDSGPMAPRVKVQPVQTKIEHSESDVQEKKVFRRKSRPADREKPETHKSECGFCVIA